MTSGSLSGEGRDFVMWLYLCLFNLHVPAFHEDLLFTQLYFYFLYFSILHALLQTSLCSFVLNVELFHSSLCHTLSQGLNIEGSHMTDILYKCTSMTAADQLTLR